MKVDTQPFPSVNMVEGYDRTMRRQLDFALGINMVGLASHHQNKNEEEILAIGPKKEKRDISQRSR
jgi:hypothetical protein